ncbi:MAG: Gfo/Idh/MocA family oxidoreductase [Candidatus Methanoperedens sp.]|nr:Gfo/Idh/MocA family oxidoreductase [Candidatus Methanoperedens sp.]
MKILVVGCGSIGERHIRNLIDISNHSIIAFDTLKERLNIIKERYDVETCDNIERCFENDIDAVIVCTPPNTHIKIADQAITHRAHVFIEKPISDRLDGLDDLIKKASSHQKIISVGYCFRFSEGLKLVKNLIDSGKLGRILSIKAEFGQYLPDWRPWQNYRQSYTAKKDLGGGIILDGSHEIDYLYWLLGDVKEVFCFSDKISDLEVETEDTAEILLRFSNGAIGEIHLDFIQRAYSRNCKIIGEKGTLIWNFGEHKVSLYSADSNEWIIYDVDADVNLMYIEEMKHFLHCIDALSMPLIDARQGKRVLEIALAAKESSEKKSVIDISVSKIYTLEK